jgi:hypothetical protein
MSRIYAVFEMVQNDLKTNLQLSLLDIGSCNLHVVHGAFRDGANASGWDLEQILSCLNSIFKDTPARREDFTEVTGGCNVFPLKFCSHRWTENVPVCERALELLPHMKTYITAVTSGKLTCPQTKAYAVVRDACSDPLIVAKIMFCISIANQLTPFLKTFQADRPMVVYLCEDLFKMVKCLMNRVLKQSVLKDVSNAAKIIKIDLSKNDNYVEYSKIDVGFGAENELNRLISSKKVSDRQVLDFRMKCRSWIKSTVTKLVQKTALKYSLARNLQFLDPRRISEKDRNRNNLKSILTLLIQSNRVSDKAADDVLNQYSAYVDDILGSKAQAESFRNFKSCTDRLDALMFNTMANNESYSKLWPVVRMLLVLSHGQASVERGFSVNSQIEVENLTDSTFKARRVICDYVEHVGGIDKIDVSSKNLLLSVASARSKYTAYLEEQKQKKNKDKAESSKKTS